MSQLALELIEKEKREQTGKLDLGNCGLTDFPKELFELTRLTELSLCSEYWDSNRQLWIKSKNKGIANNIQAKKLPKNFARFSLLQTLRIGGDWDNRFRINDCSPLKGLKNLQSLSLSFNEISDIRFLSGLSSLQSLSLSGNEISDIRFLSGLSSLQSLSLSFNEISDISILSGLSSLQSLYLRNNQISDYSFLSGLSSLESLDLINNQISDIRFLSGLSSLESLYLRNNQINDISFLSGLSSLESLDLSFNQIRDIRFLSGLSSLESLSLSSNKISDIRFLSGLSSLESLSLSFNEISDISILSGLSSLQSLSLSSNKISDYSFLSGLSSLQSLNLSSNKISDIRFLSGLSSLESLDLRNNGIRDIQSILPLLQKGIPVNLKEYGGGGVSLYDNPLTNPPLSVVEQGRDAVLAYFEQTDKQGTEVLNEARVVIVGEPGAGKTTLFRKLEDETIPVPDPDQESTHGININRLREFRHANGASIRASIWDFGGQDTQNYLHQYFYAKDNLFILVCDHRAEKTRFNYWFEMITRLCAESRVIVVRNQNNRETAGRAFRLDEYRERFAGLQLTCIDADLSKNDTRWKRLIETVEENLSETDTVNQRIPKTWKKVREDVQKLKDENRNYIALDEYEAVCKKHGLDKEEYRA